jgi:hypothetical protein
MEDGVIILKIWSRSNTYEMVFIWSKQGVVKGQDVATWWFMYLGCNACLVSLILQPKFLFLFFCIFFPWKQTKPLIVSNNFVGLSHGFHHLKSDLVLKLFFLYVSRTKFEHAWCIFSHAKTPSFFHHSSFN